MPVIEKSGGKVLVRAEVEEILVKGGKAVGVRVKKGTETHEIKAPMVISDAGVYNTFQRQSFCAFVHQNDEERLNFMARVLWVQQSS